MLQIITVPVIRAQMRAVPEPNIARQVLRESSDYTSIKDTITSLIQNFGCIKTRFQRESSYSLQKPWIWRPCRGSSEAHPGLTSSPIRFARHDLVCTCLVVPYSPRQTSSVVLRSLCSNLETDQEWISTAPWQCLRYSQSSMADGSMRLARAETEVYHNGLCCIERWGCVTGWLLLPSVSEPWLTIQNIINGAAPLLSRRWTCLSLYSCWLPWLWVLRHLQCCLFKLMYSSHRRQARR